MSLVLTRGTEEKEGTWLRPARQSSIIFKINRSWAILRAQPILPQPAKPNLAEVYTDTWLSWLELHTWRCGTRDHACSE
jgi:hypothetical protein